MYLVTLQFGYRQPHERELIEDREQAVFEAMQLSGLRAPTDLSEWMTDSTFHLTQSVAADQHNNEYHNGSDVASVIEVPQPGNEQ